ncbi:MAG: zinc-ribbon domain-containing protein [Alphaproteobacteria bacterium]|nr:zinc-ribbon domain-containing protein [Alphaproteobacteria bacterium]
MNLTCPSCSATFLVEPGKLGPAGRRVRCSECRHTWRQVAVGDDPAPKLTAVFAPKPEPAVNPATEQATAKSAAEPFAPSRADAGVVEVPEPANPEPQAEAAATAVLRAEPRSRKNPFLRTIARRTFSKPARPQPKQPQVSLAAGLAISAMVVTGMASGFYYGRAPLAVLVTELTQLYDLAGRNDEAFELGLELRYIDSADHLVDGERVVVAEGLGGNLLHQE